MFNYLKILLLNRKYKGSKIFTSNIHPNVRIGQNVLIAHGCCLGKNVTVDSYSYINKYTDVSSGSIGKFCSIASFCSIGLNNHPTNWISSSPNLFSILGMVGESGYIETKKPPIIGNDVWIGTHSVILKGVQIGDGAIISAGSIVTKNVPPFAIVGGVPAKIIKYRFENMVINKLLTIKWWDKNEEELISLKHIIEKKNLFIKDL
jgi:acetyltransferase-like isoleucine patch superfamily enzyme